MRSICRTILTISCSPLSFTACPIDTVPYLLPCKHGSMPIGHSVKTSFRTIYEESPFFLFVLCHTIASKTDFRSWKYTRPSLEVKKFLLCFDKMWYWFQDEASAFLAILMPAAQMIVWVGSDHELSHLFQPGQINREAKAITDSIC